ncbi:MAG TPA: type IV pilus twitching motility protein PilT, partial [Polyangiaceae bacterium]|nr:type IV pilus twitching motility protein PilT [Polyangiaceae bacterium]
MAQLDRFIQAMFQRPGSELFLTADANPVLRANGRQAPLMDKKPSAQQLRQLVGEIVPTEVHDVLKAEGAARFSYQMVGHDPVDLQVADWNGVTTIVVRQKAAELEELTELPKDSVRPMAPLGAAPATLTARGAAARRSKRPSRVPRGQQIGQVNLIKAPKAPSLDFEFDVPLEPPPLSLGQSPAPPAVAPAPVAPAAVAPAAVAPAAAARPAVQPAVQPAAAPVQAPPSAPKPVAAYVEPKERKIDELFNIMVKEKASDLHMSSEEVPMLRKDGDMVRIPGKPKITASEMKDYLWPIMPQKNRDQFEEKNDTDFAYEIVGLSRFRCNVFRDRMGPGAVFRTIPTKIISAEELGLPQAIQDLGKLHKGLVLVTGPTGSGKSTTLAALIDLVNRTRSGHLITIEDPIEFVHPNKKCLVNQREVGVHTDSFKHALRAALREDPDIILVGEMRDLETIAIAIETAETGHLVFGTLHTTTAYSTVDRIIDQFPTDRQEQIRVMLSESLKGVVSQTLCKKIGGGRCAALEILIGNSAVANLIREGKTFQ